VAELVQTVGNGVYGHFGPKTLPTQDISALCVWCRSVSHFYVGAEVSIPKCLGQFGTKVHETLRTQNKKRLCFECVKNVDPLYIRYPDGMEVLGKRLTKVVSD